MTLADSHPPCARLCLGITHLRRCWRRDGWAHVGIFPARFPHCQAPGGAHAEGKEGKGEGGVSPGKAAPAPPPPTRAVTITCFWGVGDGYKVPSIQGCADGVSSLAQRCLSGPRNLCPDPGSMARVRAAWRKYGLFSVPCGTHPRLTSPRRPTMMRAQTGWKAPVPHASRWVRLWGCSTRTKLAHSI